MTVASLVTGLGAHDEKVVEAATVALNATIFDCVGVFKAVTILSPFLRGKLHAASTRPAANRCLRR